MNSHTNMLTDDITYKTRGIGMKSAWHYEDFTNTETYVIDKADQLDFLNEVDFEGRGILTAFEINPETGQWASNICSVIGINSKARLLFAQNANIEKVFVTLRNSHGFTEDQADLIVKSLGLILNERGVTSEITTNRLQFPTSYEAETANIFARSIEGTLRLNGIYCPTNGNAIIRASHNPLMASTWAFDTILQSQEKQKQEKSNIVKKTSRKSKITKRGKKRVRAYYDASISALQEAGFIPNKPAIRFTIENNCKLRLLAGGIIEVNGKRYDIPSKAGQAVYTATGRTTKCKSAYRQFEIQLPSGEWKSIEDLRKAYIAAGKPTVAKTSVEKTHNRSTIKLSDIVEADILPTRNIRLSFPKKGIDDTAIIDNEGRIVYAGKAYTSPSTAANAVLDAHGAGMVRYRDGWTGWKLIDELGKERTLGYYRDILG